MRTLADRRERRPPGPHLSSCRSGDLAYVRTSAQRLLAVRQVARVDGSPAVCISDDRAYLKAHRKTRRERLVRVDSHTLHTPMAAEHTIPRALIFSSLSFSFFAHHESRKATKQPCDRCDLAEKTKCSLSFHSHCVNGKRVHIRCVCTNSLPSPLRKICMGGYIWVGVYKVTER